MLNISDEQIARQVGVSATSIRSWLGPSPSKARTAALKAEAKRLRGQKLTNAEIQEKMGISYNTVWQWLGPMPREYRKPPKTTLPQAMHDEALRLRREEKLVNSEIAARLEISVTTVAMWIGTTPQHIRKKPQKTWVGTEMHHRCMYLRECGHNIREIAEITGVPRATVGGWVKGVGCYGVSLD